MDCPQVGSRQAAIPNPPPLGHDEMAPMMAQLDANSGGEEGPKFPHMRVGLRHSRCRGGLEEIWLLPSTGSLRGGNLLCGTWSVFSCPFASFGIKVDMGSATRQAPRYLEPRPGWVTASGP